MIALAIFLGLTTPVELDRMVKAIELAENSPWDSPGGALQFKASTWWEETNVPYEFAKSPTIARQVATHRLRKHIAALARLNIPATPYLLGSMWNRGFTGALRLQKAGKNCLYGERVNNLFEAYTQ